jgi:O-antigen/teichoic acid export membrane protein
MPKIVIVAPLTALAVNIVLNLLLFPTFGAIGAGAASSAAYFLMLTIALHQFRRGGANA